MALGEERGGGGAGKERGESSGSAWAHVGMQGGVRVLTLSLEKLEPPSVAGEDEPHT